MFHINKVPYANQTNLNEPGLKKTCLTANEIKQFAIIAIIIASFQIYNNHLRTHIPSN